jgi:hypothetical protein
MPAPDQALHGRLKRLTRWLDNPRLDEVALWVRWLRLTYRFGTDLPLHPDTPPRLPILLDTTYFEPFAVLLATVPCGSRGLPIAFTTYHRTALTACLPPRSTWPDRTQPCPVRPRRGRSRPPATARPTPVASQNRIEVAFLRLIHHLVSPALRPVVIADRGFARAELCRWLGEQAVDFVIRFTAATCVQLAPDQPPAPVAAALNLHPGDRRWVPTATYHAEERVPIHLLGVWERGQEEPWYLATTLPTAAETETAYRWRMRTECTHRDEKTGVLLREGGDDHALRNLLHLHRLILALCVADWVCALVGLQAWHDLPTPEEAGGALPSGATLPPPPAPPSLETAPPHADPLPSLLDQGPADPPPVVAHRRPPDRLPRWMRRFAVRGALSYVRLGCEVLRAPDLLRLVRRAVHWLGLYLWSVTPLWIRRRLLGTSIGTRE